MKEEERMTTQSPPPPPVATTTTTATAATEVNGMIKKNVNVSPSSEGNNAAAAAAGASAPTATTTAATTTNAAASDIAKEPAADDDVVDDDDDDDMGGVMEDEEAVNDDEDALLTILEKEQEEKEKKALEEQPKDIHAAPQLLRIALEKGEVKADESEEESDKEKTTSPEINRKKKEEVVSSATATAAAASSSAVGEKVVVDGAAAAAAIGVDSKVDSGEIETDNHKKEEGEHHVHHRVNQLDFLLSKASEYSNFIAKDLEELQANMSDEARRALHKAEKKDKKRKQSSDSSSGKRSSNKKLKTSKTTSKSLLVNAQEKDAKLRAGDNKPIFVQPPNLAKGCYLKDYQLEGVRWLASLYENGVSGILADEMGLGKTIQCVALIAHLLMKEVTGPFLIVAPLATLPNWVREFEKWLPSHPVIRFHGTAPERDVMYAGPLNPKNRRHTDFPFIVTSYETAIREQNKLMKLGEFTYIVVDEGHRLKNHRCCLISSLKKLKAANRLLLSGTPIQNTLDELWSLLNFVNPTIFDDLSVFQSWFGFKDIGQKTQGATDEQAILLEERKNQTVTKLHEILRPFLLRRIKTDVISELPPKKEVIVYSGVSKLQAGYADMIDKGILRDTLIAQGIEDGRTLSQNNKQMNHRKNINHPFLFGEPIDPTTGIHLGTSYPHLLIRASGKFALLDRMLDRLHRDGHQVLIFSQMTKVLNVMEDYLRFRKWNYCRIDGSTNIDERQRQMDVFNAEKTGGMNGARNMDDDRNFVFLLSTRAGGLGINLTAADTCIIFDSDFNPFNDNQAQDRCHRLGQTLPVAVYRLLTVNSVDIDMMERQISKKKLERMTIAGGDFRKAGRRTDGNQVSFDQLTNLLQSDIKDLNEKGADVEDIKISDEEFEMIMDRKRLFASGPDAVPSEGKMYDLIDAAGGDVLGAMNA